MNRAPGQLANATTKVIALAERAQEIIEITELEPSDGTFIGKHINRDGSITQYPTRDMVAAERGARPRHHPASVCLSARSA